MKFTSLLLPLSAAGSALAHGFLSTVTINDNSFAGNRPQGPSNPSIIRQVSAPDPNYGASNPALTCGPNPVAASDVADANPGNTMTFDWRGEDGSHWPHNTGPMITYMASCGSSTCDKFDDTQAKWFKIHQVGRKPNSAQWVQQDVYDGGVDTVTLPSNLAPGNYLIRHEIIALHLATSRGMAEFYPGCAQLRVGGSGTGKPAANELVSFPGGYSDDDPGIYDQDVYDTKVDYTFPGPPVAAFVSGQSGSGSGDSSTGGSSTASAPPSTATSVSRSPSSPTRSPTNTGFGIPSATSASTPPTSTHPTSSSSRGKVCALRPQQQPLKLNVRPRHLSRIMRRLSFPWSH